MPRPLAVLVLMLFVLVACDAEESPSASTAPSLGAPSTAASAEPEPTGSATDAPASGPRMTDTALGVEVAASGLTEPTGIGFIAPDQFFVTEKSTGEVHLVDGGNVGEPVLDLAVNFFDERGLLGIAVHPEFDANGFVYLYWTASGEGEGDGGLFGEDTDEEFALPELGNRVDRFVWDGETLTWDRNIVEMLSNTLDTDTSGRIRGNHDGGQMVFGQDNTLYFVNGDQNLRGELQNIDGQGGLDPSNWAGVVVRVNDDGSIPEDNPFVDAASEMDGPAAENLARTWAYGVRNSFGLAIHPETGDLWQTENGDDSWDEVNIFPGGANSGWWQTMGPVDRHDQYRDIETASEDGTDNPDFPPDQLAESGDAALDRLVEYPGSTYVDPVFAWVYPPAVTSIAFVTDDSFGESSTNTAWLGTVLTDSIYRYPLAEDGSGFDFGDDEGLADLVDDNAAKGDLGESADYVVGEGFGVITHIVSAPDGLLYVSSITAGTVYRIGPAGEVGGEQPAASAAPSGEASGEVIEITVGTDTGSANEFVPDEISVPAGATVRLTFVNESESVPHNLTFGDPINAATATTVAPGEEETIEFTAPEAGEYTFVCTLHPGMEGTLVVEDA
ncbi:MAG TPA: PQQ-dependent sugar dehydrogenase [Patescibacteria group bacterium]|nr:PQQ-dependent sugar dehydrogenase [Patescibacteria group bacterium]